MDRAEQLEFAMASIGVSKASTIFVGDRLNDLKAAKGRGRIHDDPDPQGPEGG